MQAAAVSTCGRLVWLWWKASAAPNHKGSVQGLTLQIDLARCFTWSASMGEPRLAAVWLSTVAACCLLQDWTSLVPWVVGDAK